MTYSFLLGFAMPGPGEMMIVLAIVLLLFGGSRLPSLMRNLGRSTVEFRKGMKEDPGGGGGDGGGEQDSDSESE